MPGRIKSLFVSLFEGGRGNGSSSQKKTNKKKREKTKKQKTKSKKTKKKQKNNKKQGLDGLKAPPAPLCHNYDSY